MGQSNSTDSVIPETVETLHDDICRQARSLSEIAALSYDDFLSCMKQLNQLCSHCTDKNGKQLFFIIKKGTDSTLLWKGTVKIICVKFDPATKEIEEHRIFNLGDFLKVFRSLQNQLLIAKQASSIEASSSATGLEETRNQHVDVPTFSSEDSTLISSSRLFSSSMILEDTTSVTNCANDCCICLERKPNIVLPCTHSYCVVCIEQWNVNHKTCPICREACDSTDDSWVISEIPGAHEINEAICAALMELPSTSGSTK